MSLVASDDGCLLMKSVLAGDDRSRGDASRVVDPVCVRLKGSEEGCGFDTQRPRRGTVKD